MMKAKILNVMDEYLSNTLFCRGGQKRHFFSNYRGGGGVKMTPERWQHHNVTFTQRLVGLLVKSVDFSNLFCVNGDHSKWGNSSFSPKFA